MYPTFHEAEVIMTIILGASHFSDGPFSVVRCIGQKGLCSCGPIRKIY
jgi:hypothetical protein